MVRAREKKMVSYINILAMQQSRIGVTWGMQKPTKAKGTVRKSKYRL